ncbi:MAG: TIGR03545 family protein [Elusimicrobiales bacterium]|nr:TIGR03545 family protein [Elusimicrobiales bacterium]
MRWSYIAPRLALIVLVWAFFFFAFDPLLKWGLIKGIEKGAKARTEIASVRTTVLPPSLSVKGLAVGDAASEFTNLCEFSSLEFRLEGRPLLEKKFVIDRAALAGLKFGTPRKTSARLPLAKEEPPSEFAKEVQDTSRNFALDRAADVKSGAVDSYKVEPDSLESIKLAKELERKYEEDYKKLFEQADVARYQARMDALKADYEKAKGESNIAKQAKDYAAAGKELKKLTADFKKDKEEVQKALDEARSAMKALEEARRRDTAGVLARLKLPSLDKASLARMLAGPAIASKTEKAMKWLAIARRYMPQSASAKTLAAESARGRVVHFPKEKAWPSFLIRELEVSGELDLGEPLDYSGRIEGITTQPKIYGKPLVADIKGAKGARSLQANALVDATGDALAARALLTYTGMAVKDLRLGSENSFLVDIKGTGNFDGKAEVRGGNLSGKAVFNVAGASFSPKADAVKTPQVRSALLGAFDSLKSASLWTDIGGTLKAPKFSVDTDLAGALSAGFSKALGAEVKKAQDEAAKKVDAALEPYKNKLDKLTASNEAKIREKLGMGEKSVGGFAGDLEQKLKQSVLPGKVKLPKFKI